MSKIKQVEQLSTRYPISIIVVEDLKLAVYDNRIIDASLFGKEIHSTLFDYLLPRLATEETLKLILNLYKRYSDQPNQRRPEDLDLCILTISEALINVLGIWIEKKLIPHDAIEVILYQNATTRKVHRSTYDEKGVLINFPIGYFDPL